MKTRILRSERIPIGSCLVFAGMLVCLRPAMASPQQRATTQPAAAVDEEEQLDSALRKFGYVSGQACQCQIQQEIGRAHV